MNVTIEFVAGRKHKKSNDCWADALALATGKTYRQAYNLLKNISNENGSIDMGIFSGTMQVFGFTILEIDDDNMTVEKTIKFFDSKTNKLVMFAMKKDSKMGHIVYVNDSKIHDFKDPDFLTHQVYEIYIKELEE